LNEINVGLQSTADNSAPVLPGVVHGSKVDMNGRQSNRPPRFLLKLRYWFCNNVEKLIHREVIAGK